jgi:queuosine precursor transporter
MVWFFFNLFSIAYALLIINLPNPTYALHNPLFNSIFNIYLKTSIFFILSHLFVESLNTFLLAKLKLKLKGYYLKLRLLSCIFLSLLINDGIICLAKSFGNFLNIEFFPLFLINLIVTLVCLPITCCIIDKIKKLDKIDIYDQNTQFNFFKFEVQYILSNNKFKH